MTIEIISGSPRKESLTYPLAVLLHRQFQEKMPHKIGLLDVRKYPLPMIENVFTSVENTPEQFQPLAERMFAADAFIIVSPEYNGSYSPAMKNMFDHFPMQSRKTFGIVTASVGAMGGIRASQQMQLLVNALFGICSPHMLITPQVAQKVDDTGHLLDKTFQARIDFFIREFIWLAERVKEESLTAVAG